ncbi:MAG: protoporphyrinogen oxidase [Caldilineaceae bacterium]|nr:protoporphyrinogen oxidase [Caldilineaceae bacterium]
MALADHKPVDVAIIGGGISGLATAYYLQRQAEREQRPLRYTLLERSRRAGGKIITEQVAGFGDQPFVVEGGPDSFITQKPWALQLARELGLEERILGANDHLRKTYVLNRGKPTPLPDGVLMIVPTRFLPFALSPLISPLGKLRMGLDFFIPAKRDDEDETLADFIRRRLGDEALDKIAEPLMSGIYNAEAERQSLLATFPRFRDIEKRHGSLIRGMLASKRSPKPAATNGTSPKPVSMFTSLHDGTQELVDTLFGRLTGDICLGVAVTAIAAQPDRSGYRLTLDDGTALLARQVALATPAFVSADLLRPLSPGAADLLASIRYVSTGTISLGFRRDEVAHPLNGFGVVIPRSERRPINAITWSSTKFNHRAPDGHVLLRVFFGGSRNPQMVDRSDEELLAIARRELDALLGIRAEPVFHRLFRWRNATPQYDAGHLQRVAAIEAALPTGIYVTGSPYRGIGIPDCVHQAQGTAGQVWQHLTTVSQPELAQSERTL